MPDAMALSGFVQIDISRVFTAVQRHVFHYSLISEYISYRTISRDCETNFAISSILSFFQLPWGEFEDERSNLKFYNYCTICGIARNLKKQTIDTCDCMDYP